MDIRMVLTKGRVFPYSVDGEEKGFARARFAAIRSFCRRRIREFIARFLRRGGKARSLLENSL